MPNTRWNALQALVNLLKTVTPGNGYTNDLSPTGVVTAGILPRFARVDGTYDVDVQVEEGSERHSPLLTSPDTPRAATLELVIDCLLRGDRDEHPRLRLNNLLQDISLVVGKNPTLSGTVQRALLVQVDKPAYEPAERLSSVTVRVVADYDYVAGVTT